MTESRLVPSLTRLDASRVATLEWKQPRRGLRAWELTADGVTVATLARRGPWRGGWIARTADAAWRIRRELFGRCEITREGDAVTVADSRRPGFRSVEIGRAGGETLRWRRTGFFRSESRLENREGFALFTEQPHHRFLRREASITLEEAGRALPDLLPLLLLMWALSQLKAGAHAH